MGDSGPRILVIRTSALGDIVHALPVLRALRRQLPAARIGWVVEAPFAPLLDGHPELDELLTVRLRTWRHQMFSTRTWKELSAFHQQLKRFRPEITLDLMGNHQRLEIRSWASALRMAKKIDFEWQPNLWYRMKLRVDIDGDRALVRGKVWPKSESEPEEWQISAEDPLPIRQGSPGLYGYSPTPVYFDNVKVTSHKP